MKNNNLSVSLLAIDILNKDLKFFLKILKKNDIKFIELPITKLFKNYEIDNKKLKDFKNTIKKYDIKVSSIQSIFHETNINIFTSKKKIILNHIKSIFRFTKLVNCKNIIFGSPKNRFVPNNLKKNIIEDRKNFFFSLVKKNSMKHKINFLIEPNSKFYGCNYIINFNEATKLVKKLNSKYIKLNLDTGNFFLEKKKLSNNKNFNSKHIGNYQLSEIGLKSLLKKKVSHIKILDNFVIKNKFISLEVLHLNKKKIDKEIMYFKKLLKKYV